MNSLVYCECRPGSPIEPDQSEAQFGNATPGAGLVDEVIPEADLAVLENYHLLQDYDFLKKFDIADLQGKDPQTSNPN